MMLNETISFKQANLAYVNSGAAVVLNDLNVPLVRLFGAKVCLKMYVLILQTSSPNICVYGSY